MIKNLEDDYIEQVAGIHKGELTGFLPELGIEFLVLFYKTSLELPEMFTFVEEEKGRVAGFVSGGTDAGGLNRRVLLSHPLQFGIILLKYIITHPEKINKFIRLVKYPGFKGGNAELLTLAVLENRRLKGIGRGLFNKTADEFEKRGVNKFKISAYAKLPANRFYKKMGCKLISSFEFLGEEMNYYEFRKKL